MRYGAGVKHVLICAVLGSVVAAQQSREPSLSISELFTDNMIVQRGQPLTLFGHGVPGSQLEITFAGETMKTGVSKSGIWIVGMGAKAVDQKVHEVVVSDDKKNRLALRNVMIGDVWIVAGQSNMSRPANGDQIKTANYPNLRFFNSSGRTPRKRRLDWPTGWTVCTPAGIKVAGDHWRDPKDPGRVTIRAFSEVGYVFGRTIHKALGVPVGLIQVSAGGSKATDWIPVAGIEEMYPFDEPVQAAKHKPGLLYHIRMRRLTFLNVKGAIWYQGEDDGRNLEYHHDLQRLIKAWRGLFRRVDMPFYMAQIGATSYASGMLAVYEAQQRVMNTVPSTGVAFSNDIYEDHLDRLAARSATITNKKSLERHEQSIAGQRKRLFRTDKETGWPLHGMSNPHPPNKELVATRLGRIALSETYGRDLGPVFGPMLESARIEGDKVIVKFKHVGDGLRSRDGQPLTWFEISANERRPGKGKRNYAFVRAQATITGKDTIELRAEGLKKPRYARFSWHMYARNNLVNSAGLPAFPFRTEKTADPRKR
jgi:hypothetical protein